MKLSVLAAALSLLASPPPGERAGPDWWSLRTISSPAPPGVRRAAWVRNPIDSFILRKLEEKGLEPAPEVDRAVLIRRATFDLHGLPPAPEEIEDFIADRSAEAYERVIDRFLASPRYGERWGRHWLDVVRFGESHGYETNALRPTAWPYRDYVIRAFNEDTPLPRFVLEQLAGDTIPGGGLLTQAATGFLVGGTHDVVGNQTIEGQLQQRMDDLDDMITATGTAFLGLTTGCARCHDHKFDPISQRDYYALQAVFQGVEHAEREVERPDSKERRQEADRLAGELAGLQRDLDDAEPLASPSATSPLRPAVDPRRNVDRFPPLEARRVRFTVLATSSLEPCIDELEVYTNGEPPVNLALAGAGATARASSVYPNSDIHRLEHLNDGRFGNGRSWISNETGKGWVEVELPRAAVIDRVVWGRDREERFKDRLATGYRIEASLGDGDWRLVASSGDRGAPPRAGSDLHRRRDDLLRRIQDLSPTMKVYAGSFGPAGPAHLLRRGDPREKDEVVPPGGLSTVRPPLHIDPSAPEPERRRALALWIGHPENPLPPRVMANRVWHYHFGQGLVASPSNLGFHGGEPSHPELLDWLASEYAKEGHRLKPLHRLILLSSTYRESSRIDPRAEAIDRKNRLLWRVEPRRLEAEAIRDSILSVSGKLDLRMGGPGYSIWEENTNYVVVFKPKADLGPDTFRRMVYGFKPRSQEDPIFGAFDCPDGALVAPRRNVSTTPLQALNLLNSRFTMAQAGFFAERLQSERPGDPASRVKRAFFLAFGREPSAREGEAALELCREHGLPALCRALFNANEFLYVH